MATLVLAHRASHLALNDVDEAALAETVAMVERSAGLGGNVKVTATHVDVTDRSAVEAWASCTAPWHSSPRQRS